MSDRTIALDKQPGVRPVGIGEMWRRIFPKIVLKVTVLEATMVCQDDQICPRIKLEINSAIHGVQYLSDENLSTDKWYF